MGISFNPVSGAGGTDLADIGADATAGSVIFADGSGFAEDNANLFWDDTNNRLGIGSNASPSSTLHVADTASTSGVPAQSFYVQLGAHTGITAGTNVTPIYLDLSATITYDTGAVSNYRGIWLRPSTLAFSGASTVTDAAAIYIAGGPLAGSNATITNSYAIYVDDSTGKVRLDGGLVLGNSLGTNLMTDNNMSAHVLSVSSVTPSSMTTASAANPDLLWSTETHNFDGDGGTIAEQRMWDIRGCSYSADSALTITDAATIYIGAAPSASANVTITNSYALWVDAGASRFDGVVLFPDGAVGAPSVGFLSDTDTGVYLSATGTVAIAAGGIRALRISSSSITPNSGVDIVPDVDNNADLGGSNAWRDVYAHGNIYLDDDDDSYITSDADDTINIVVASTEVAEFDRTSINFSNMRGLSVSGDNANAPSTAINVLSLTSGAHSNIADINMVVVDFDLSQTHNFVDVTTDQTAFQIKAPTYTSDDGGGDTITNAATVYINAAPTAGANVTITNSYALWVDAGNARFDGQVGIQDGSVGSPGIFAVSDTDTGIYIPGTAQLGLVGGSSLLLWLNSTTSVQVAAPIIGDGDNTLDLGSTSRSWRNAYIHTNIYLDGDDDTYITSDADDAIQIFVGSSEVIEFDATSIDIANTQGLNITQVVVAGATAIDALTVTSGAHTTLTASTEMPSIHFDLSATQQWATGALTNQRAVMVSAPTYAFVGASTITDAATLYIDAAPTAGTNATITNAYALWVDAGASRFDGNIIPGAASAQDLGTTALPFRDAYFADESRIYLDDDDDTWIESSTDDRIQFFTAGVDRMSIGPSTIVVEMDFAPGVSTGSLELGSSSARWGAIYLSDGVLTSGTPDPTISLQVRAHTSLANAEYIAVDFDFGSSVSVEMDGSGTVALQRNFVISPMTYIGESATLTLTQAFTTHMVGAPVESTNAVITQSATLALGGATTMTAAAGTSAQGIFMPAYTVTFTGTTGITSSPGVAGIHVSTITVTDSSALTVTNAAALYIEGAPAAGGSVTLTNTYSIWCDAGIARFDGDGSNVFELPADATDPTGGGGAATGRIPVKIGGSTFHLAYY